jgi:hypothetical protein
LLPDSRRVGGRHGMNYLQTGHFLRPVLSGKPPTQPEEIVAYGVYKRSLGAGEQQPSEAARLKAMRSRLKPRQSTSGKTKAARRVAAPLAGMKDVCVRHNTAPQDHGDSD